MGKYCILCKAVAIKGALNRSFHRFPAPQYQKELWCQALEKDIMKLSTWTFVCSDHFSPHSFVYRANGQRFLKDDAVPLPFREQIMRKKRKTKKLEYVMDPIVKTECKEKELINVSLDKELKLKTIIANIKCIKTEKYEPEEVCVKTEAISLKYELTEELDIKTEEYLSDEGEANRKEVFETLESVNKIVVKDEEICQQPEIEMAQQPGYFSRDPNNNILRKMFKSMYPVLSKGMYLCTECSFKTSLRPVIRRHFLAHRENEYKQHPEKYKDYKTFHCKQCNYVSVQKYNVSRHVVKHQPKDDVTILYCDSCDYSTKYRCDLVKHRMTHEPDGRRWHCSQCSYKAYQQVHLKRHVKKAHIENKRYKFECKMCSYKTDCMGHLNRHMRNTHGTDTRKPKRPKGHKSKISLQV